MNFPVIQISNLTRRFGENVAVNNDPQMEGPALRAKFGLGSSTNSSAKSALSG